MEGEGLRKSRAQAVALALPGSDTRLAPGLRETEALRVCYSCLAPWELSQASAKPVLPWSRRWSGQQNQASAVLVASHALRAEARPQGRRGQASSKFSLGEGAERMGPPTATTLSPEPLLENFM